MMKYLYLILYLKLVLPVCYASSVYDYHSLTWNTNGQRWGKVWEIMNYNYRKGNANVKLDVICIQEAGTLAGQRGLKKVEIEDGHVFTVGPDGAENMYNPGVTKYTWDNNGQKLYLYYYTVPVEGNSGTNKQNLAILSRHEATDVMAVEPFSPQKYDDIFIDRPVLGITFRDAFFFNIHARPRDKKNESPDLISSVFNYMGNIHTSKTWMVMGDYNREPESLGIVASRMFNRVNVTQAVVRPSRPSRQGRTLDFAVVGGPATQRRSMSASLLVDYFSNLPPSQRLSNFGSDHEPVIFNL